MANSVIGEESCAMYMNLFQFYLRAFPETVHGYSVPLNGVPAGPGYSSWNQEMLQHLSLYLKNGSYLVKVVKNLT